MTIQRTLSADEFRGASAEDQALYAEADDGNYTFVGENAGELRRGKTRLSADLAKTARERDELAAKLAEYERGKEEAAHEKETKASVDAKRIDEYWKAKHAKELKAKDDHIKRLEQSALRQYRDSIVTSQASKLALPEHEYVIKLALEKRINATLDSEGKPQTVIYDSDGRAGHDSLADLEKEFKKDARFKKLLKGADVGSGTATPPPAKMLKDDKPSISLQQQSKDTAAELSAFRAAAPDRLAKFLAASNPQ